MPKVSTNLTALEMDTYVRVLRVRGVRVRRVRRVRGVFMQKGVSIDTIDDGAPCPFLRRFYTLRGTKRESEVAQSGRYASPVSSQVAREFFVKLYTS